MNDNIVVVKNLEYGVDRDFWESNELMNQTFVSYDEYYDFWQALAQAYPEGVPEEYLWQKIEQYRYFKMLEALEELEQKNVVIRYKNEDGEDIWRINPDANLSA